MQINIKTVIEMLSGSDIQNTTSLNTTSDVESYTKTTFKVEGGTTKIINLMQESISGILLKSDGLIKMSDSRGGQSITGSMLMVNDPVMYREDTDKTIKVQSYGKVYDSGVATYLSKIGNDRIFRTPDKNWGKSILIGKKVTSYDCLGKVLYFRYGTNSGIIFPISKTQRINNATVIVDDNTVYDSCEKIALLINNSINAILGRNVISFTYNNTDLRYECVSLDAEDVEMEFMAAAPDASYGVLSPYVIGMDGVEYTPAFVTSSIPSIIISEGTLVGTIIPVKTMGMGTFTITSELIESDINYLMMKPDTVTVDLISW